MEETISTSPATNFAYIFFPALAFVFATGSFLPPPPRSVPQHVILLFLGFAISLSGFISYRIRAKVAKESQEEVIIGGDEELSKNDGAISCIHIYNTVKPLMRPSLPIVRIYLPTLLTLFDNLLIRLFSKENGGMVWLLNFGPVLSESGYLARYNIALLNFDGPTFGVVFQGVMGGLLIFPAINGYLAKVATKVKASIFKQELDDLPLILLKPCLNTLYFLQLLQSFLTYYPLICTINLLIEAKTYFAQGANQSRYMEYALGGFMGVALGSIISALIHRKLMNMADTQESRTKIIAALTIGIAESQKPGETKVKKFYAFGKASEYKGITKSPRTLTVVQILSLVNLIVFTVTIVILSYAYGATWLPKGEKFCFPMIACFFGNYATLMICFFCFTRWKE